MYESYPIQFGAGLSAGTKLFAAPSRDVLAPSWESGGGFDPVGGQL